VSPFFVGIKGGEKTLRGKTFQEIDCQAWQIAGPPKPDSPNWISAEVFREIYEQKRASIG
jgi:hypothetical protein